MKAKISIINNLFNLDFVKVISSPSKGVIRRVFPANHFAIMITKPKQLTHMNI